MALERRAVVDRQYRLGRLRVDFETVAGWQHPPRYGCWGSLESTNGGRWDGPTVRLGSYTLSLRWQAPRAPETRWLAETADQLAGIVAKLDRLPAGNDYDRHLLVQLIAGEVESAHRPRRRRRWTRPTCRRCGERWPCGPRNLAVAAGSPHR